MTVEEVYCRCEEEHSQKHLEGSRRNTTSRLHQVIEGMWGEQEREGAKRSHGIPEAKEARILWESRSWGKGRETQRLGRFRVGAGCASQGDSVTGAYHTESLAGGDLLCYVK